MQSDTRPCFEPLESRTLLAADVGTVTTTTPPTPADNSLSALFGGSILFNKRNGGVNRLHTVVRVDSQTNAGALTGSATIAGLGTFQFTGTATNGLVFLNFNSDSGSSGTLTLQRDGASGNLRGELAGVIAGVATVGNVRLHDNGGTPSPTAPSNPSDSSTSTTNGNGSSGSTVANLAGVYSGTVQFRGNIADDSGNTIVSRRVHAVLHLDADQDNVDAFTGTLRLDTVGRFTFSGSLVGKTLTLIFNNGAGSGAMLLTQTGATGSGASFASSDSTSSGEFTTTATDLRGKLFATVGGFDVHAIARLHRTASTTATGNVTETVG
jgi:hypothetical protein